MATRFELMLHGDNPVALRAAGEEALDEIDRIEAQLSLYRGGSEVAKLNKEAHQRAIRVTPGLFRLLEQARDLSRATNGAFDVTIAPLVRCWGFMGGTGAMPDAAAVADARAMVGMEQVKLEPANLTVRFARPGVMLDFGAIGKGYALDRAAELLREAGVASALIHGGTSTSFAIGTQPDGQLWKVAITAPRQEAAPEPSPPLAVVDLEDESLSVSAVWGRSFRSGDKTYGHVIDPRTGAPADSALLSAVVLRNATETDALSTALLTAPDLLPAFAGRFPGIRCLVAQGSEHSPRLTAHGITPTRCENF
jgi:thiamine biosynthesis lipoprotein